jgi:amidase
MLSEISSPVQLGETANNLIGRTLSPVNQLLSCGGSSAGAALFLLFGSNSLMIALQVKRL